MTDEVLVAKAQTGDRDAADLLVRRHRSLAEREAREVWLRTSDREDVRQEALIAITIAIRYYRPGMAPFRVFAKMVIKRHLNTLLRLQNGQKHRVLTFAEREAVLDSGEIQDAVDVHADPAADVASIVERRERLRHIIERLPRLSVLERAAVTGLVNGIEYVDIAASIGADEKSVDNAMQRARRKLAA